MVVSAVALDVQNPQSQVVSTAQRVDPLALYRAGCLGVALIKLAVLRSIGVLTLMSMCASSAQARFPLTGTLPKEQKIFLLCRVDDMLMAKDCGPQSGSSAASARFSQRTLAFIQVETAAPDYLVGATPGTQVLVMVRRSTASPLDEANPGRAAAPASPAPMPVTNPDWGTMPNAGDLSGYFPELAERLAVSGNATARCTVGPRGDLLGCWVAAENPLGMGFGFAVLDLSTFLQMKPTDKAGSPTVGRAYALQAAFNPRTAKITLSSGH